MVVSVLVLVSVNIIVLSAFVVFDRHSARRHAERLPAPAPVHPCAVLHKHILVIAAQPVRAGEYPATAVLKYCPDCKNHFDLHFKGAWTLEDFQRDGAEQGREVAFLEGKYGR